MLNKDVYIDTSGAKLVVKVVFIDFPPTEVNERERSVKNETIYVYGFKRGQSIHFSMLAEDLVAKMKKALLKIGIFKVNDTFPICHIFTHLSGCACDMVRIIISLFKQISICSFLPRIYIYIYIYSSPQEETTKTPSFRPISIHDDKKEISKPCMQLPSAYIKNSSFSINFIHFIHDDKKEISKSCMQLPYIHFSLCFVRKKRQKLLQKLLLFDQFQCTTILIYSSFYI